MSYYKELKILGFKGFSKECSIEFAIPNEKEEGSGLTILVGENNSGKTSISSFLCISDSLSLSNCAIHKPIMMPQHFSLCIYNYFHLLQASIAIKTY